MPKVSAVLRREWFGGLLVRMPNCELAFCDEKTYLTQKALALGALHRESAVRVVDVTALGYPLRQDSLSTPGTVFVDVTRRCDGTCTHCYAGAGPLVGGPDMPFEQIEGLLRRSAELGAYYVRLTGGEPTMRDDLPDIVGVIVEEGMKPSLNTHGRFGHRTLQRLLEGGLQDIRVSLDGPEEINDAIRGNGSFQRTMATLSRLAEYNESAEVPAEPTINVVLMRSNRHCVRLLMELAAGLRCRISFGLLRPAGRADLHEMLSPAEVAQAALDVAATRRSLGMAPGHARVNFDVFAKTSDVDPVRPFPFDRSKCELGTIGIGITAEGRVVACNYLGSTCGGRWLGEDIRGRDLLDLWHHSAVLNQARNVRRSSCHGCRHYMATCNGGCPVTAAALTGELDGRDPYCVRDVAISSLPPLPDEEGA